MALELARERCGCKIEQSAGYPPYIVHCPKHAEVDNILVALAACQRHINALTSLGPGCVDIDAARAAAATAGKLVAKARGGAA